MGWESFRRRNPGLMKAVEAGTIITIITIIIIGGTGLTVRRTAIDMSDRNSIIAIDPSPGTDRRLQAAKTSGGAETERITIDPPQDAKASE